jgi:hypothetical protein
VKQIRFVDYRRYEERRVEASNAMMALLAGAGMASHLLQLTDGSKHLLPEVFPQVPHIKRFNLTTDVARGILDAADVHLSAMSIPYVLALHDDFLRDCLTQLEVAGRCSPAQIATAGSLAAKHPLIASVTGGSFNSDSLGQLTAIRLMRNCMIHAGGRVDQRLVTHLSTWTATMDKGWVKVTGRSPQNLALGDELTFGHGEMILTLAVTKVLSNEANQLLQLVVSKDQWADLVIADLVESNRNALSAPDFKRRARGLAAFDYGPAALSEQDLEDARQRKLANP